MPVEIFRCNYCYHDEDSYREAEDHEETCSHNPELKNCFSCKHYVDVGMPMSGPLYRCHNEECPRFEKFLRMKEERETCSFWVKQD